MNEENLLVTQILAGEKELFRVVISRYQQKVHAMGLSFFHNAEDADDFTQEVFIRCYQKLASFKGQSRFSTWLYRVAYNTAVNDINRRKVYSSLSEEPLTESGPEEETLRRAAMLAVREAVAQLPEKYRLCIDLYFFYGCTTKEIEEIIDIPENTIKSHVYRAKKLLKTKLIEEGDLI